MQVSNVRSVIVMFSVTEAVHAESTLSFFILKNLVKLTSISYYVGGILRYNSSSNNLDSVVHRCAFISS